MQHFQELYTAHHHGNVPRVSQVISESPGVIESQIVFILRHHHTVINLAH